MKRRKLRPRPVGKRDLGALRLQGFHRSGSPTSPSRLRDGLPGLCVKYSTCEKTFSRASNHNFGE
jgi:hypothetical protein